MRVRHDRNDYGFLFMNNNKRSFLQTRSPSFSLLSSCFLRITASLIVTMCQGLVSPLECSSKASEHPLHTLTPSRDLTWAAVMLSSIWPTWFINISGKESLKLAIFYCIPLHITTTDGPGASWVGGCQVCVCGTVVQRLCNGSQLLCVWETQHVVIKKYLFIIGCICITLNYKKAFREVSYAAVLYFKTIGF